MHDRSKKDWNFHGWTDGTDDHNRGKMRRRREMALFLLAGDENSMSFYSHWSAKKERERQPWNSQKEEKEEENYHC